jgi:hypothetical protein
VLRPDSPLITALADQDVAFGTQVLALAMPHDVIVPADRAGLRHEQGRVLGPEGLWGHSSILDSEAARTLTYNFLRDGAASCSGAWDRVGPWIGRALGAFYRWSSTVGGLLPP